MNVTLNCSRRRSISSLVGLAWVLSPTMAWSDAYPSRSIRIIVGFPPGQSTDTAARLVASKMSEFLGQSMYIDNKPGATGSIAHEAAKAAPGDGYTLLFGSVATLAINPAVNSKLRYDVARDFEPVGSMLASPLALFTRVDMPVRNIKEMIAYVRTNAGKTNYGSPGNGTSGHVTMEMFKQATGLQMTHVPYKGSPQMITDIIGGQLDFAFEPTASIVPLATSGRAKLLAVTSPRRLAAIPDVPTVAEQGFPDFEVLAWGGLLVPKGTPEPIIVKLNEALQRALKDTAVIRQFEVTGAAPFGGSAADFKRFLVSESARWGKAARAANITVD